MKILITGATGFVGTNLHDYLRADHDINSISIRYQPKQKIHINSEAIIHLAGKAHDLKQVSNPSDYYEANFELTKQLFDSFLDSEAKVFIFMSTVKAIADEVEGILTEDAIPNPKTHYGIAKQKAEAYLLANLPDYKKVYILRPCMIHGPGNKGNLNLMFKIISKGLPWPLGAYDNQRSFLSIENLNFVIKELIGNPKILSGIYNVSDTLPLSTNKLVSIITNTMGIKRRIVNIPKNVVNFVAKIGDKFKLPLNTERLQKLTESYLVSNTKICDAMQKSLPISSEEGMKKTIQSFKIKD